MMAAADGRADRYVSLAGVARGASLALRDQIYPRLPTELKAEAEHLLTELEAGRTIDQVPAPLMRLFAPSVQPHLISWFRFSGSDEIAKLHIPGLIVQGTTDEQVTVAEARRLAAAKPAAGLDLIPGMNHILKSVADDRANGFKSYSEPTLPVVPKRIDDIAVFVRTL